MLHYSGLTLLLDKKKYLQILFCLNMVYFLFSKKKKHKHFHYLYCYTFETIFVWKERLESAGVLKNNPEVDESIKTYSHNILAGV